MLLDPAAMLAEMGVRVWQPTAEVLPTPVAAPISAADPAPRLDHLPDGLSQMDWPSLKNAAAECRACGLCEHRQQSLFAEGAPVEGQRTDWLIIGGSSASEAFLVDLPSGQVYPIDPPAEVPPDAAFGRALATFGPLPDGTSRLFVGEPGYDGERGRVHVYSIR